MYVTLNLHPVQLNSLIYMHFNTWNPASIYWLLLCQANLWKAFRVSKHPLLKGMYKILIC